MKLLLTLILIITPLFGNCQGVYQVTGQNLQPSINQYKKTIDSLKIALTSEKYTSQWALAQLKYKEDSILLLKKEVKSGGIFKAKADSLEKALDRCLHPPIDSALIAEILKKPYGAFDIRDSLYGTKMLITQELYDIIPTWKFKTIYLFPVSTTQGIKVKKLTFINE